MKVTEDRAVKQRAHQRTSITAVAEEWNPNLRVVCGFQQLSAEMLQLVADESCRVPGLLREHPVDYPGQDCQGLVAIGKCVVWNKTLYCGVVCAEYIQQYSQQLEKLEAAERDMPKLQPGNWRRVESNRRGCCQRCLCTKTLNPDKSGTTTGDLVAVYNNTELVNEAKWTTSMGVCALCAQVVARHQLVCLAFVRGTISGPRGGGGVLVLNVPDGLVLVPRDILGVFTRCEQRSVHCYGGCNMSWAGPLVFWNTTRTQRVCVFCADENGAVERQGIWDSAARDTLLSIRFPSLLPVEIVDLVGEYQLGRYFDSVPIFMSPSRPDDFV